MPTQTLAEAAKRINNELNRTVAEDIIDTNPIFRVIPFTSYQGQSLNIPREQVLGDVGFYAVGDTITHEAPSQADVIVFAATKIIGHVRMDNLVQGTSGSAGIDQLAYEMQSKAKNIGIQVQTGMVTGDGVSPNMRSFHTLVDSTQYTPTDPGSPITKKRMNQAMQLVKSKNGRVDFGMASPRTFLEIIELFNDLSSVMPQWLITEFGNQGVLAYRGVPIFQNDFLSETETADGAALTGGALSSMYFGVWDDGSKNVGVSMVYPEGFTAGGVDIDQLGQSNTHDENQVRIKQYTDFGIFNRRGVSRLTSIAATP